MTLADLSSLGSFISALAVAGSLIYLGLQTHQAAKHTRALIHQGRAARLTDLFIGFSDVGRASALIVASGLTPTPEAVGQHQARQYFSLLIIGWVDAFEQRESGLLSQDQFADVGAAISICFRRFAAFHVFWDGWKKSRPTSHVTFKAWIDGIAASQPAMEPGDARVD